MKWFNLKQNKCPQCNQDFAGEIFAHSVGAVVRKVLS